eukprot:Lithocolla_globosa_v1_NODE_507_length_3875_cov_13.320942.p3 type:complete len:129 gc:universal NODE_507_length_3875_cov_13.320942:795-1181(+)
MFVQTSREVSIEQETIRDSLPDDSSNKAEVTQVIRIDIAVWIGLERTPILCRSKQGIIRVEDFLRQNSKKLTRQATGVNSLLVPEGNMQTSSHFIGMTQAELMICVFKDMFAPNVKTKTTVVAASVLT